MKKYIETGKIVGTHGIKGMVRVQPWSDSGEFLSEFKPREIEILPFHTMGYGKYEKLGLEYKQFNEPDKEMINHFKQILEIG